MKKLAMAVGVLLMLTWGGVAGAELPRSINLQTMVYDLDGNVTRSEFVDVSVEIVDENGSAYFREDHYDVPIVQGAMNLLIGEASGGIPLTALDPAEGRRFVNVLVDNTNPFDILPLSSVPYAIWADRAQSVVKDAITGENIKDGSIEPRHFAEDFEIDKMAGTLTDVQIPPNIVRQEVLDTHTTSTEAHPAGTIPVVTGAAYPVGMGTTVQVALEKLYSATVTETQNRQITDNNLSAAISSEASARQSADSSLSSAIAAETSARQVADAALQAQMNIAPPPNQFHAYAWCSVLSCMAALSDCANASVSWIGINQCRVTFGQAYSSASYAVMTTPSTSVSGKTASSFVVGGNAFDVIVVTR